MFSVSNFLQSSYKNLQIQPKLQYIATSFLECLSSHKRTSKSLEKAMPVSICLAKHLAPCQWCHTHGSDPVCPLFILFAILPEQNPKQRNQQMRNFDKQLPAIPLKTRSLGPVILDQCGQLTPTSNEVRWCWDCPTHWERFWRKYYLIETYLL